MKKWFVLIALLATDCGYLMDGPSEKAASRAHDLIRPGMSIAEVMRVAASVADKTMGSIGIADCRGTSDVFSIRQSGKDETFVVERITIRNGVSAATVSETYETGELLTNAVSKEPLNACESFRLWIGKQWNIPLSLNTTGRVTSIAQLHFVD